MAGTAVPAFDTSACLAEVDAHLSALDEALASGDADRIDEVLAFAEGHIDLGRIASGAGHEIGLGREYEHHGCLDAILQELGRFPGRGPTCASCSRAPTRTRATGSGGSR